MHLGAERMILAKPAVSIAAQYADGAQKMLIHRIMVVHRNCIIATMRPKSGMNRPSTPASFIRRSAVSGALREVRISRNSRLASGRRASGRRCASRLCVTSRVAFGWMARSYWSATQNRRMRLTGSRSNASSRTTLTRSSSIAKSLGVRDRRGCVGGSGRRDGRAWRRAWPGAPRAPRIRSRSDRRRPWRRGNSAS